MMGARNLEFSYVLKTDLLMNGGEKSCLRLRYALTIWRNC